MRAALEQVEHRLGGPAGTIMVVGRHHAIDEGQPQGESKEQTLPVEQTQETEEGQQTEERQSRHLSHSFAALVVPVLQSHRGQIHSGGVPVHRLDHRVRLQ